MAKVITDANGLEYFEDEAFIISAKLQQLKEEHKNDVEFTSRNVDPWVYDAILVTDQRIVIKNSQRSYERDVVSEAESGNCLLAWCCCCFGFSSKSTVLVKDVQKETTRVFQTADLKNVEFHMYTKEENLTNVEVVASGGCCGMAAPKVQPKVEKEILDKIVMVEATLSFVKKPADFMPGWQVEEDIKTYYETVVLKGSMKSSDAQALRRRLLLNDAIMKPSTAGATALHLTAGKSSGGLLSGLSMPKLGGMPKLGAPKAPVPSVSS